MKKITGTSPKSVGEGNESMKIKSFLKEIIDRYSDHDVAQTAGQIAYFGFLSLFPFIVFINFLLQRVHLSAIDIMGFLSPILPKEIVNFIVSYMEYISPQNSAGVLSIGIVVTIYLASRVIRSMEQAVAKAYGIKKSRSFFGSVAVSAIAIICIGLMLIAAVLFIVLSRRPVLFILNVLGLENMVGAVLVLKWAFVIFIMLMVFSVVYKLIPYKKVTFSSVVPGTLFSLAGFMVMSAGFGWYVTFAATSSSIYGYIGTVFIALLWLYFVGVIFVLGAEINGYFDSLKEKNILN